VLDDAIVPPFIRIVVLNYDGGEVTIRCIESLQKIDYPSNRFEIFVVDNGSIDGLDWRIPREYPKIKYVLSLTNEGFARGCNIGMSDLAGVDAIALVNNDAIVEPSFLRELTGLLMSDGSVAGVSPLMLLDVDARGFDISSSMGACIKLSGLKRAGQPVKYEVDTRWSLTPSGATTRATGSVWTSATSESREDIIEVELSGPKDSVARIVSDGNCQDIEVSPVPSWHRITINIGDVSVVNNAGGIITNKWFGGDRGFKQINVGQYDEDCEIFTFCGGAVLLRSAFLRDIGTFDPSYFLYYEDTELSLRGRRKGWRFMYTPRTTVTHRHSFSSVENSAFFNFWVDRNRRITLIRHAPLSVAVRATATIFPYYTSKIATALWRAIRYRRRSAVRRSVRLLREMLSTLKAVPNAFRKRSFYSKTSTTKIDFTKWLVKEPQSCE
jgi:GT2 family glycosyltransferase